MKEKDRNFFFNVCMFDGKDNFRNLKGFSDCLPEEHRQFETTDDDGIVVALNNAYMNKKVKVSWFKQVEPNTNEPILTIQALEFITDGRAAILVKTLLRKCFSKAV